MLGNMPVDELALLAIFLLLWPKIHSSESSNGCWSVGEYNPHVLEMDGDIILGGLFPLHYSTPPHGYNFTDQPQVQKCSGFDLRAFRWVQTMVFAIEEINRNPRLLPGVKLGYRIMDGCDHVHTSLQRAFSLISYFATCTCLTDKRMYPTFLRTVPSDVFQVHALVKLMAHFGWHWVGTIGTDDDYSHYGIQAFTEKFNKMGGCVDFHQTIPKQPTTEQISAITDALEASTARVIVVFATEGQLQQFLSEVARRNLTGRQWVASEAWVTANLLTSPLFQHVLTGTLGFSFRGANISGLAEFLLKVQPSNNPGSVFTNMFWEEQFNCRLDYAISEGLDKPFCTGLENLKEVKSSYTSVTPARVSYNVYKAIYAVTHALHQLLQCTSIAQASGQRSCNTRAEFTPGQLLYHLRRVNFTNQFGEMVYFDVNGEPVPLYDIINWQKDGRGGIRFQRVGSYDGSAPTWQQLKLDMDVIEWTGGQSQIPVSQCTAPCPPGTRQAMRPGEPICCFDCLRCTEGEFTNTS
ncbi:extracellular calcium-sensing receptor-like, partial [Clarias magur]